MFKVPTYPQMMIRWPMGLRPGVYEPSLESKAVHINPVWFRQTALQALVHHGVHDSHSDRSRGRPDAQLGRGRAVVCKEGNLTEHADEHRDGSEPQTVWGTG